ncbi:HAMP domain-containing sensor histidine kinase [Kribbella sp. CA-247076]|uniref:HAMP domain-containing sensor histidine kinase n=1 Tax=Kribbella sp. CA-247076 TaxID=3239941 RepID=UPI003D8CB30C
MKRGSRRRWSRLGLRGRITSSFALLALGLSALLSILVWLVVSNYLTAQRETTAVRQAQVNVVGLERSLQNRPEQVPEILGDLPHDASTTILLFRSGRWYSTALVSSPDRLPAELIDLVRGGTAATQRLIVDGEPVLAVGEPMDGGAYFELFPLTELDQALRAMSVALPAGAVVTTLLGAGLGRTAARQALAPLTAFNRVAGAIARGDRSARLDSGGDPDLADLARSFNETASALQRRLEADARFTADVAHELRTPVTTMLNSLELLADHRDQMPAGAHEPLDLLTVDLHRFQHMVKDLLEMSRAEDRTDNLVPEPTRIGELVSRAADRAAGRTVTFVSPGAEQVELEVDRRRIVQVIANLVHNAEIHGGGLVRVAVEPYAAGVRIFVDDAGPGVPDDRRERIFERFARATGEPTDGAGLGLAIVARHVRLHHGRVWVEDRPGGGARFVVELTGTSP